MNKVILMGRLTRNPDIRYSQGENSMAVARFTLAVDRRFKRNGEDTADFISCVAFGKTAEFIDKYTRQGTKLCVEGRIQTGSYTRPDNTKVYTTDVVVENAEFAESKAASAPQGNPQYQAPPQNAGSNGYAEQGRAGYGGAPSYNNGGQAQGYNGPSSYDNGGQNRYDRPAQPDYAAQSAPMQEAADEGFMQIPDELNDEGLPFN